jgi:type IV secretory pathway ATPase VirB11/archaellum biosynthesis ATPase
MASNLLAPVCISAFTVAYGSFRMEPNYMIAGESAGVAAALAIKSGRTVHHVNIVALQSEFRKRKQIISVEDK